MRFFFFPLLAALVLGQCSRTPDSGVTRGEKRLLLLRDANATTVVFGDSLSSALHRLSGRLGMTVDESRDYSLLEDDSLKKYGALIVTDLVEDSLLPHQRTALERYVQQGNGLLVADADSLRPMSWYWYKGLREDTLAGVDSLAAPLEAGTFDGGRVARWPMTSRPNALSLSTTLPSLVNYLIGDNRYDSTRVRTPAAPDFSRFTVHVLDDQIDEPMQMTVLPHGEVLFLERKGKMKLHDTFSGKTRVIAEFDVCTEGNYEDGLHGLALDPAYGQDNHWLYLYYSPAPCDTPYQYLSRFEFKNGELIRESEIVMLRVLVQRETCCHSGGSVRFGPDSLLYLSTGDNTSSKESNGYTPIDERPGRGPFDAQKSSSNTHDLRGKIIRIRPQPDGTYSIPEGNLFPPDGSKGRPEIYAMGCRNPFRIAIDPRTNFLYWGDVGPDVGEPGRYGPQSYDEFNQARKPGFFGWPYFVADNQAYPDRDFVTDSVGPPQDPTRPINDSPNNYGSKELPPAQPAMIFYPYGPSEEFPQLGQGSRSALAGPFYYKDNLLPLSNVAFPDYYVGKWFIYEWARSWIKVVTFDSLHQPVQIEDFLPDFKISKPIDMSFGPDGSLYVLEYGNDYFLNNPDARLIKIDFAAGNRPPLAALTVDAPAGAPPHSVRFAATGSHDLDPKDSIRYQWFFDGDQVADAGDSLAEFTFIEPGEHLVRLVATDRMGAGTEATTTISVGNAPPVLALATRANRSFYFGDKLSWPYSFTPRDPEDERGGGIDPTQAIVNATYVADPLYLRALRHGEAELPGGPLRFLAGARLIAGSDCGTCHYDDRDNVGPSFQKVAQRYDSDEATVSRLAEKIIRGGNGVWGERMMSAHPQMSPEDAALMTRYILSLDDAPRLALSGRLDMEAPTDQSGGGFVVLARYRDRGYRASPPLTGQQLTVLRSPRLEAEDADAFDKAYVPQGGQHRAFRQVNFRGGGRMTFSAIDLLSIRRIRVQLHAQYPGRLELRLDDPQGPVAATTDLAADEKWEDWREIVFQLPVSDGIHDIHLTWVGQDATVTDDMGGHRPADLAWIDWVEFER